LRETPTLRWSERVSNSRSRSRRQSIISRMERPKGSMSGVENPLATIGHGVRIRFLRRGVYLTDAVRVAEFGRDDPEVRIRLLGSWHNPRASFRLPSHKPQARSPRRTR